MKSKGNFPSNLQINSSFRSSPSQMFLKIGVLKNFGNFTAKHLCWSLFLILFFSGLTPATLLKKRLQHRCFPVKFLKILKTPFFTEHLRWLPLLIQDFPLPSRLQAEKCRAEKKNLEKVTHIESRIEMNNKKSRKENDA